MYMAPWMAVWPGLALAIVVYGVNMFGDALRDLLDPKLRGGVGRYGRTDLKAVKQSQGLR
jgi:peptide/nickel transport system permease protein